MNNKNKPGMISLLSDSKALERDIRRGK